jgi:hypothetical protein
MIVVVVIVIVLLIFGQVFQGWKAAGQILRAQIRLRAWRDHGVHILHKIIEPIAPKTVTYQEIDEFIYDLMEIFIISPEQMDFPQYNKIRFLITKKEERLQEIITQFLPGISSAQATQIKSIVQTTNELNNFLKKVEHDYILAKKTRSIWFVLQTASQLTQIMYQAFGYASALDSLLESVPIGDSIGPLSIQTFLEDHAKSNPDSIFRWSNKVGDFSIFEFSFEQRRCIFGRASGSLGGVGHPADALQNIIDKLKSNGQTPKMVILIDAYLRLEGETPGIIGIGLGAAVGDTMSSQINRYQIESLTIGQNPPIPIESIVCRESFEEAVRPISDPIRSAIPKILRILRRTIRTQSKPRDSVIVLGIGNCIGVPDELPMEKKKE